MAKQSRDEKEEIILRQITDHILQCLSRIENNIEHIVFIRKNSKIQDISGKFYIEQIDRFSRDTLIAFNQILDKDRKGNTLHSLILKIKDKQRRKNAELKLEKIRKDAELIIFHRNKVIAHHETDYNSKLGDWYPAQPFNYIYIINPCYYNRIRLKTAKLFWYLKSTLRIDGFGVFAYGGGNIKDIFRSETLGATKKKDSESSISHKCRYKDCLLK